MNTTISDIISVKDISSWTPEKAVFISAGTGRGKSHFIKNKLYDYAQSRGERILLILHRKNCHQQFEGELEYENKTDIISTVTYQAIEQRLANAASFDFSSYTYIVCDEYHYFLEDADFNTNTDISFRAIIQSNKILMFLSATGADVKEYVTAACNMPYVEYQLVEEDSRIRSLNFFHDMDITPVSIAHKVINSGKKAIFFIQSAEAAWEIKQQLGRNAVFNCSTYNKRWSRRVDTREIDSILEAQSFKTSIFVTTACFDAGINIKDKDVTTIVVDIMNISSAIQCIGRRRIDYSDPSDQIDVYVHVPSRRAMRGVISGKSNNLVMADYLLQHGTRAFVQKYPRKAYPTLIYDNPQCQDFDDFKRVNRLKYYKDRIDIGRFRDILSEKSGYQNLIADRLCCVDRLTGEYLYNEMSSDSDLIELLEYHIEHPMWVPAEREALIRAVNVQSGNKTLRRAASLNEALERRNFPYQIIQYRTSRMENGKKVNYNHAWRVERRTK